MDKALQLLSLSRKAGKAELGEEPVGAAARSGKAYVIAVACDAGDHTWRRGKSYAAGTQQQCVRLPYTKDEMGQAIGRSSLAMAAITDPALALALVQTLPPERCSGTLEALTELVNKQKQRLAEQKAHKRNIRKGKK